MDEELKQTPNNDLDFSQELIEEEEKEEVKEEDKFVKGFPEWDLLPTNQVVRRVTRK